MSETRASSIAVGMDRLSDRIGAFVPGGSRWPSRHPVKVCLVMGLMGFLAAWLESVPLVLATLARQRQVLEWMGPTRSAATGLLVVLPFVLWSGRSWPRAIATALASASLLGFLFFLSEQIGVAKIRFDRSVNAPDSTVVLFYFLSACIGLLIATMSIGSDAGRLRWPLRGMAALSVPGALFVTELIGKLTNSELLGRLYYVRSPIERLSALSHLTLLLAIVPVSLALSLGLSLWYAAAAPKFEPAEDRPAPRAAQG